MPVDLKENEDPLAVLEPDGGRRVLRLGDGGDLLRLHACQQETQPRVGRANADGDDLRDLRIVQVVAVGARHADTRLRLLMAGVAPERITPVPKAADAANAVKLADCEQVFVLFEVYRHDQAMTVRNAIAERMRHE